MAMQNLLAEFAEALIANDQSIENVQPGNNIRIHHNNMMSNLTRALQDVYPLIEKLVGKEFFHITALQYIKHYPARSGNLSDYGEYFSDFLAEYPPLKDLIYLAQVAQFEWICHTLFFAADATSFNLTTLQEMSPDQYNQLHFSLHPASRLCKFHYPILRIVDLCKGDGVESIDLNEGGVDLLIIRRYLDLCLTPLSPAEFTFLSAIHENKPVAESLEIALAIDTNFKLDEKLPAWIKDHTIVDCFLVEK